LITELSLLQKLCDAMRKKKKLTKDQFLLLSKIFGERFNNAYEALRDRRVKKYCFKPSGRTVWIVVGKERDYQVIPEVGFCACDDFYFRVINHETYLCYHLLAQKLAEALGEYERIEASDQIYDKLMEEWRKVKVVKKSLPIAEIKDVREASFIILSKKKVSTAHQLLTRLRVMGFDLLTPHHLAIILATDPKKRFECENGVWTLRRS